MVQGRVVIPHNHLDMEQHQGVKDTLECGEIANLGVNVGNILQGFSRHNIGMDKAFPDQAPGCVRRAGTLFEGRPTSWCTCL